MLAGNLLQIWIPGYTPRGEIQEEYGAPIIFTPQDIEDVQADYEEEHAII